MNIIIIRIVMIVFVFIYEGTKYGEKFLTIVMSVAMVLCL